MTSQSWSPLETRRSLPSAGERRVLLHLVAARSPPHRPPMEALVCAFSELRIQEDAVSRGQGRASHPDTPPNIYEGGLGAQQQQSPGTQGSKPKNFRLRHLRGLALYLPGHMRPAGQCESHWLGRLLAGGCLPPQGAPGPGNSPQPAPLEAQLPRDSLGITASSTSMDPAKGAPSQPHPPEGLGLRPKRSWGTLEESVCPLCKRTRFGALDRD
ncbi:uncharacterized protein C16orf90 homolog isoform X1 [Erinaceus europaeus]|uniref:Uncharacterized protein C16orf90 homolog isoform X1 n=1 Tax=Erinaceus europaeus TaxID=9365 RepID=A0A1S2ZNH5_ERIEU|nr:uncharacterized protein C16orf90 homolog isoform X1 [Erinaceus europaeus]